MAKLNLKQKKFFWVVVPLLLLLSLFLIVALNPPHRSESAVTIGINQYVAHPILDAVYEGLKEGISKNENIQLIYKNSNADAMTCQQINQQFVNSGVNVIVALGTPAAQSAVSVAKGKITVVYGAITDPIGAKLADSLDKPGGNKTGTTNRWPFEEQVRLINKILPNVQKVGVIVNPGEENCVSGMTVIKRVAQEQGLDLVEVPISNSGEIKTAVDHLINSNVDAILISPSNTVFTALDTVINLALEKNIPIIGGDETAVQKGSIATYGFSNKDVGIATAKVVMRVLKGEKAGDIPVAKPQNVSLYINKEMIAKLKLSIPKDLK